MSKLVFGIMKIVSFKQEQHATVDLPTATFAEAYAELRRACPRGDICIHLFIEANSAEEVGATYE
jgi:hypothetical protein